jgi:hypothetical protein
MAMDTNDGPGAAPTHSIPTMIPVSAVAPPPTGAAGAFDCATAAITY